MPELFRSRLPQSRRRPTKSLLFAACRFSSRDILELTAQSRRRALRRFDDAPPPARPPGKPGAALLIDLRGFHTLHDKLEHGMDERLLEMAALRLQLVTREADTVARLRGGQFMVLLDRCVQAPDALSAAAEAVAGKVRDILGLAYELDGLQLRSLPSVDVVLFGAPPPTTFNPLRKGGMVGHAKTRPGWPQPA